MLVVKFLLFMGLIALLLTLDMIYYRPAKGSSCSKQSWALCAFWIAAGLLFGGGIFIWQGPNAAFDYYAAYLLEKSLSIDNVFVFIIIFSNFRIEQAHQHRILFGGIVGAIVSRLLFIFLGAQLLERFHWLVYPLGLFIIYTAYQVLINQVGNHGRGRAKIWAIKWAEKWLPVTEKAPRGEMFARQGGRIKATRYFIALVCIEITDIVFALDSIPATLAITTDPFVVYTSNIFALLGLRALYFFLASSIKKIFYLHYGIAVILVYVGLKIFFSDFYSMPAIASSGLIAFILMVTIFFSLRKKDARNRPM